LSCFVETVGGVAGYYCQWQSHTSRLRCEKWWPDRKSCSQVNIFVHLFYQLFIYLIHKSKDCALKMCKWNYLVINFDTVFVRMYYVIVWRQSCWSTDLVTVSFMPECLAVGWKKLYSYLHLTVFKECFLCFSAIMVKYDTFSWSLMHMAMHFYSLSVLYFWHNV